MAVPRNRAVGMQFLSTLPARGATHRYRLQHGAGEHFYPRSPRGERRRTLQRTSASWTFLSTLPARGATKSRKCSTSRSLFLSTLPARGATDVDELADRIVQFLSTLPARGATPVTSMTGRAGK